LGNNIKQEMNRIAIPEELHQRSVQGILQAKQEMGLENYPSSKPYNHKLKWLMGFVAMVSLLVSGSILIEKEDLLTKSSPQLAQEPFASMASTPYVQENANIQADRLVSGELYNRFADLKKDASVIVEGDVIESITLNEDGQIQTHSKVKVRKDYKKVLNKDEVVTVIEKGGVTTLGSNQSVEVMFEVPVMKLGERVLIFATEEKKEGEEVYLPLGGFQGKFIIDNDYIERIVPEKLEGHYLSLRTNRNEFERIIASQ
jgi:hypothetical protein